jgi:ABC-type nitrate/sulfonate/bicarbonate transport system substrate-binding protein
MNRISTFLAGLAMMFSAALSAQEITTINIGWGAYPDVPQIAVASDKKLWAAEKLDVKIIPFTSGRAGFEALIGGQLDFAVMAEFPAVSGAMRNLKFAIPAVLTQYNSYRIIAKADKPLAGLKALSGKKIAIPLGTNIHYMIADALEAQGVTAELVNVQVSDMITALSRGDVDAIGVFSGGYQNAKRVLGPQYQEIMLKGYNGSFVLAASEKAAANPALIRRILSVLLKAEETVDRNPTEAQEATARYVGAAMTPEAVRTAWPDYEYKIKLDLGTLDTMVKQGKWLKAKGFVKEGEPNAAMYEKVFMTGPLRSLMAERVQLKQ